MKKYVFNLDNTLFYTDNVNNYKYKISLLTFGLDIKLVSKIKRITREVIVKKYPFISKKQLHGIINRKEKIYPQFLEQVIPNKKLLRFLNTKKARNCILWTSASKKRVISILNYFNIENKFCKLMFSKKENMRKDVEKICSFFCCEQRDLVFFENNKKVVKQLKKTNIKVVV